jgi:hypothetical protein
VKADKAFAQVRFNHQQLGSGERFCTIGAQQPFHVLAVVDGFDRNVVDAVDSEASR